MSSVLRYSTAVVCFCALFLFAPTGLAKNLSPSTKNHAAGAAKVRSYADSTLQNDECGGAIALTQLPDTIRENTRLATPNPSDPPLECADGGGGNSVWFTFKADSTEFLTLTTRESSPDDYDLAMGILTGSCGNLSMLVCNDDIVEGYVRQAEITLEVQKDSTYYIYIGEWKGGGPQGGVPTGGNLVLRVFRTTVPMVRGPMTGHSAKGAQAVLSRTPEGPPIAVPIGEREEIETAENPAPKLLPFPPNATPPLAPKGSNFQEDRIVGATQAAIGAPHTVRDFKGFDFTGAIPPDVPMAVGPNHIVGMVNSSFSVFDKATGAVLKTVSCNSWWRNVLKSVYYFTDPEVIYDHYANRWIMAGITVPTAGSANSSYLFLSVSDSSDPFGNWYNYAIPGWRIGDSTVEKSFIDHPQIGYDSVGFYVCTRNVPAWNRVMIFDKARLYAAAGDSLAWNDFWDFRDPVVRSNAMDMLKPTIMYGNPGKFFLVNTSPYIRGTFVTVWTISNPVSNPIITGENVPVVEYAPAPDPNQWGNSRFDGGNNVLRCPPVYRDSSLWMVHPTGIGAGNASSGLHYLRIDPFAHKDLEDVVLGRDGFYTFYPTIMVEPNHDVVIGFNRSGDHEYEGIYTTGRRHADPPGLSSSVPLKESDAQYYETFGGTLNRWGDYNGICLDPGDSTMVWVHDEYAAQENIWGTWFHALTLEPVAGPMLTFDHSRAKFGSFEVGESSDTVAFALENIGAGTATVSAVDLQDSNFTLIDAPATPFRIEPYGSVAMKVACIPKKRGDYNDTIRVTSDDPLHPSLGFTLTGHGYALEKAKKGEMYAVTNYLQNIYRLDAGTGAVTLLGKSGLEQIMNARIALKSRTLTGFVQPATLVGISASFGDAHPLHDIPNVNGYIRGMTYRGDTLILGQADGTIFRYDPAGDSLSPAAKVTQSFAGMDFNPLSGDLWFSVRSGITDAIYKMQYPSGMPVLVGRTGFNSVTQDIIFDGSGRLFGIVTGARQNCALIAIDTVTGAGTLIGSMGVPFVQALALIPDSLLGKQSFGTVEIDTVISTDIAIANPGPDTLHIDSVTPSIPGDYSVSPGAGDVPLAQTIHFTVTFAPKTRGPKSGFIKFSFGPDRRDGVYCFAATAEHHGSVVVNYTKSWNLVSVPLQASDFSRAALFPRAPRAAWGFNGYYYKTDTLAAGKGYWLNFSNVQDAAFTGLYGFSDTISVKAGWNLIGALSHPVVPDSIVGIGTGGLPAFMRYDMPDYQPADTLWPGRAYWVRVNAAGKLVLKHGGGN